MALFWLAYDIEGARVVYLQEASGIILARLKAAIAGLPADTFVEGHALPPALARKVPKGMRERVLKAREATALLKRLSG